MAVQVRHLDRSLAFYRDLLGLRLQHQEGQSAQLHGYGDTAPSLVLLEVGGHATRLGGGPGLVRVAWRVDQQADLDLAEQLLQREGLTYQRRRQEGLDIVDTRTLIGPTYCLCGCPMTLSPTIASRHGFTAGSKQSTVYYECGAEAGAGPLVAGTRHSWRQLVSAWAG